MTSDPPSEPAGVGSWNTRLRDAVQDRRSRAETMFAQHRQRPLVDVGVRLAERDRQAAGTVVGSAIAFRLFLFFVPFVFLLVGIVGFLAGRVERDDVENLGVTGQLADQIDQALQQSQSSRWLAAAGGLIGLVFAGRALGKVMNAASCLAWQIPVRTKTGVRQLGAVAGLVVGIGLTAVIVNVIRSEYGMVVAGVSFLAVIVAYVAAWFLVSLMLPRATPDPASILPGATLIGVVVAGMQAFSQLYLPRQFSQASSLYGALGAAIVVLGWFFIIGRAVMFALIVNAVLYERFGSISTFLFRLPLLRAIPRRWPSVGRFFALSDDDAPE